MTNEERFEKWLNSRLGHQAIDDTRHGLGELALETAFLAAALPDDVRLTLIEMAGEAIDAAQEDAHRHVMRPARKKAAYARMECYEAARKWLEGE